MRRARGRTCERREDDGEDAEEDVGAAHDQRFRVQGTIWRLSVVFRAVVFLERGVIVL